ncbi:MAG: OmpA family protein [Ferrimonas sp.]
MKFNQSLKGIMALLPVLALTACSSSSSLESDSALGSNSGTVNQGAPTVDIYNQPSDPWGSSNEPAFGVVETVKTPEELRLEQQALLQAQLQEQQAHLREQQAYLTQQNTIYFEYDRSDIRADYRAVLEAHAAFLVQNPSVKIIVEGHADERGTPEYNIALSERRGKAVVRYLQSLGVLTSQMEVVPYGEEKLLDNSGTETAHARNRRAVIAY